MERVVADNQAVWFLANVNVSYADALATCTAVKYEVPTEAQFADLQERDPQSLAAKMVEALKREDSAPFGEIHVRDMTLELSKGTVICRKPNS